MLDKLRNWFWFRGTSKTPEEPELILVIGGTYRQAKQCVEQMTRHYDPSKYIFRAVANARDIRGYNLRPNNVIYVGTFYNRPDLEEIATTVAVSSRLPLK